MRVHLVTTMLQTLLLHLPNVLNLEYFFYKEQRSGFYSTLHIIEYVKCYLNIDSVQIFIILSMKT